MRALIAALSVTAATMGVAVGAPGAYDARAVVDAAACARACEDDSLCQSWALDADKVCQLSAVAPTSPRSDAAAGLSSRAPSFARTIAPPAPIAALRATSRIESETIVVEDSDLPPDDYALLGGPAPEARQAAYEIE